MLNSDSSASPNRPRAFRSAILAFRLLLVTLLALVSPCRTGETAPMSPQDEAIRVSSNDVAVGPRLGRPSRVRTVEKGPDFPSHTAEIFRRTNEKLKRYRQLDRQLQDLERIIRSQCSEQSCAEPVDDTERIERATSATFSDASAEIVESSVEDDSIPPQETVEPSTKVDKPDQEAADEEDRPDTVPANENTEGIAGMRGVGIGPVDRAALADSLYATGEYVLAEEIYTGLLADSDESTDVLWVEYQLAACYRHLARTGEADEIYRRLASNPESGWLGTLSRWWLDRSAQRNELIMSIKSTEQRLNQLKGIHDALNNQ